jgi:hypothetical protein
MARKLSTPETRIAARLLPELLQVDADDLEAFRASRVAAGVTLEQVQRAHELVLLLGQALFSGDAAHWAEIDAAYRGLSNTPASDGIDRTAAMGVPALDLPTHGTIPLAQTETALPMPIEQYATLCKETDGVSAEARDAVHLRHGIRDERMRQSIDRLFAYALKNDASLRDRWPVS